ncbi:hypothetical protein DFQ26_006698 [Actinomortierella ambigua]|nr:hypothetical protein DFQ26_006698 [Actinomortierella ambigua]
MDVDAQVSLARMYQEGDMVPKNASWSFHWSLQAARHGHVASQVRVANAYFEPQHPGDSATGDSSLSSSSSSSLSQHHFDKPNYARAAEWYREAALNGEPSAQNRLGWLYDNGKGVIRDDTEAMKWFTRAAEQGYSVAQFNLGCMYEQGRDGTGHGSSSSSSSSNDIEQEKAHAKERMKHWFTLSAQQGFALGQVSLGDLYAYGINPADDTTAVSWYKRAANQLNAKGQYKLSLMLYYGRGVDQNYESSARWCRWAAEAGNADSQVLYGVMHALGHGVAQDDSKAVEWCRRAANQGHAVGQFNMGSAYDLGQGVDQDDVEALRWYMKSATQEYGFAQFAVGSLFELGGSGGQGIERGMDEAAFWYGKAIQQQDGPWEAKPHWDIMCSDERGALKTDTELVSWYVQQAEQGNAAAQYNVGLMHEKALLGVPKNVFQAIEWYDKAAKQGHDASGERQKFLSRVHSFQVGEERVRQVH